MFQDVRFAVRMLARNPGVTALATMALALGIGGSTLIFSVVNAILLRPLPVSDPDRLVWIWANSPSRNLSFAFTAYSTYAAWKADSTSFESMSAYSPGSATLIVNNDPERVDVLRVNASFFPMLGVRPFAGRDFLADEDQPGAPKVAILSYGLWVSRFGGDPNVIGHTMNLDGQMVRVNAILPREFAFPTKAADVYLPIATSTVRGTSGAPSVGVYGRLKLGVPIQRAQTEINAVSRRLEAVYQEMKGRGARVWRVRDFVVRDVRFSLLVLFGAVGLVLLIACANVANLLMVRASARQREIALRTALGGARWRILRQLLTESVMLGACGGVAGFVLADVGIQLLSRYGPAGIPFLQNVTLDRLVMVFAALACLLTGIVFGLAPALSVLRAGIYETLKEGGSAAGESRNRNRFRGALVVAEVALALLLTMGATLMMHTLLRLQATSPGFEAEGVLTASITLPGLKYPDAQQRNAFYRAVLDRLAAVPGVQAASMVSLIPFGGSNTGMNLLIEGQSLPRPEETPIFWRRIIDPAYFRVMRIPLIQGREFSVQDAGSPRIAIINETMARRYWPGADPIGKRFGSSNNWYTIVGIVSDVKFTSVTKDSDPEFYEPYRQAPIADMVLTVRTASAPLRLAPALREAVHETDPNQPVSRVKGMEEYVAETMATPRLSALVLAGFGGTALLLAAIGIYGVISFSVTRRTREIGLRIALGARGRDVTFMVVRQALTLASIGVVIGVGGALALTRVMQGMLFDVNAREPFAYLGVSGLLTAVATLAAYVPARRAAQISPSVALRSE
jgi:putative ABC transport system permease protein